MKKWPIIVAILYALVFLILFNILAWLTLADAKPTLANIGKTFMAWQMWILAAVMAVAQFALLCIPAAVASGRPVAKRHIITTVVAAALMMGVLVFGAAASIFEFCYTGSEASPLPVLIFALGSWVFWGFWFYLCTHASRPDGKLRQMTRFFWAGSILELLIAIPTHIVARQRHYCCAGMFTFVGLISGMSVMLFAFGPAIYFLFVERWKRLHPRK